MEEVLKKLKEQQAEKILLMPFMIVAGDHAKNDMAGEDADSWKSILTREGYEVRTVLKGLGEIPGIQMCIRDRAAAKTGTVLVVVERPKEEGCTFEETVERIHACSLQ